MKQQQQRLTDTLVDKALAGLIGRVDMRGPSQKHLVFLSFDIANAAEAVKAVQAIVKEGESES